MSSPAAGVAAVVWPVGESVRSGALTRCETVAAKLSEEDGRNHVGDVSNGAGRRGAASPAERQRYQTAGGRRRPGPARPAAERGRRRRRRLFHRVAVVDRSRVADAAVPRRRRPAAAAAQADLADGGRSTPSRPARARAAAAAAGGGALDPAGGRRAHEPGPGRDLGPDAGRRRVDADATRCRGGDHRRRQRRHPSSDGRRRRRQQAGDVVPGRNSHVRSRRRRPRLVLLQQTGQFVRMCDISPPPFPSSEYLPHPDICQKAITTDICLPWSNSDHNSPQRNDKPNIMTAKR